MAAITICSDLGAQENKICHCFHFSPFYLSWSHGIRCHDLGFLNVGVKPAFPLSSFTFIKRFFSSSSLSASKSGLSLGMQPVLFITWKIRGGNHCNLYFLFLFFNFTILHWFCHISTWICHRYTRVPHPEPSSLLLNPPPSSLPVPSLWVVPVHQPQASSIVHRTWTGDSFHIWYDTCFNAIPDIIIFLKFTIFC